MPKTLIEKVLNAVGCKASAAVKKLEKKFIKKKIPNKEKPDVVWESGID